VINKEEVEIDAHNRRGKNSKQQRLDAGKTMKLFDVALRQEHPPEQTVNIHII
jgi:hypothetical protein